MPAAKTQLAISSSLPEQQLTALAYVFSSQPVGLRAQLVESTLSAAARGEVSLEGLFVAKRCETIAGAAWCHAAPGRIATVWPAQVSDVEPQSTRQQLMKSLVDYLSCLDVDVAQAVVMLPDGADADLLQATGFSHAADLLYLVCPRDTFPDAHNEQRLEFEVYTETAAQRLADVVERTYVDTLDCPALDRVRDTQDVLEGYKHAGFYDPRRWFFVRHGQQVVGCLLLTDHPDADQWELVYMGLIPEARGRGFGLAMTRQAQWLTRQSGRRQLLLAVDQSNVPALKSYAAAGFQSCDRRSIFIRPFT